MAAVVAVLLLSACGGKTDSAGDKTTDASKGAGTRGGGMGGDAMRPATSVEVITLKRGAVANYHVSNGHAEAVRTAPVYARIGEVCIEVLVRENDPVKEGQPLARLDRSKLKDAEARSDALAAKAIEHEKEAKLQYDKLKRNYERFQNVSKDDKTGTYVAREEIENAKAEMDKAEISWKGATADVKSAATDHAAALRDLDKATISAPIAGIVALRKVEQFDLVKVDQELFVISELDSLKMKVDLPESVAPLLPQPPVGADQAQDLTKSQAVLLVSTAWPGKRFLGYVEAVSPVVTDPERGMLTVTVRVVQPNDPALGSALLDAELAHNPDPRVGGYRALLEQFPPPVRDAIVATVKDAAKPEGAILRLKPGNFLEASIVTHFKPDALVVPTAAIAGGVVYVVDLPNGGKDAGKSGGKPAGDAVVGMDKTRKTGDVKSGDKTSMTTAGSGAADTAPSGKSKSPGDTPTGGAALTARRIDLTGFLGHDSEGFTEILPGAPVAVGATVVYRGQDYLKDGAPVRIVAGVKSGN